MPNWATSPAVLPEASDTELVPADALEDTLKGLDPDDIAGSGGCCRSSLAE